MKFVSKYKYIMMLAAIILSYFLFYTFAQNVWVAID